MPALREEHAKFSPRFVNAPGDRTFGATEHRGSFGVREAVDSDENECRSERFAQGIEPGSEHERELSVRRELGGIGVAAARLDEHALDARIVRRRVSRRR